MGGAGIDTHRLSTLRIKQVTGLPWWASGKEPACSAETRVRSLGGEEPLEKGMATCSHLLAWRIPQRGVAGCSPWGRRELDTTAD